MLRTYLAAAAALLVGLAPAAAQPAGPQFNVSPGFNVAPSPPAATVQTRTASDENPLWFALQVVADNGYGSGTPIYSDGSKTLVLTNAHVARQDRAVFSVIAPGGKKYAARRVDGSRVTNVGASTINVDGVDLAVVEVDADLGAVTIAEVAPAPGEHVYQWGYGGTQNDHPWPKAGTIVANNFAQPSLTSTIACVSGDSGSGVFNTRGELVAVTHGAGAGYNHIAVALTEVNAFMKRPVLSRLFPRLNERIEARRAARDAAVAPAPAPAPFPPAPPAAPIPKAGDAAFAFPPAAPAAPAAPKSATMYRVGNGPWISEEEYRRQYPRAAAGVADCPNGRCPLAQPPTRGR